MADVEDQLEVPATATQSETGGAVSPGATPIRPGGAASSAVTPTGPGGTALGQAGPGAHPNPAQAAATAAAAAKAKKPENIQFQIEVNTEVQWRSLLRREGLIVVDVYSSWANPCTSMISILKRIKVEVNEERLWYSIACSDNIDDLLMFKDQSQPTWLFMGGGKPVRVIRGCHAPNLISAIKSELEHEIQCIEGKSRRNMISIDDEVSRRKKAEAEASRLSKMVVEEDDEAAKTLNEIRRESSISLMGSLEPYTVAIIQPFVIEAGNAQEVKDYLMGDFNIEQEIVVNMTEENARNLYRIPYEIPDPVQNFGYVPPVEESDFGDDDMANSFADGDDDDAPKRPRPKTPTAKPKKKVILIPLPEGLTGDSIILLLESVEIKKLADEGKKPTGTLLQTADDFIRLKVGPLTYKDALEHSPFGLHAVYGRENAPGVWCPRKYDDKRYVMLNFFPRFVYQMLSVSPQDPKKYLLAVFPANAAVKMAENAEVSQNSKDIVAEGKMKIPHEIIDEMMQSWSIQGDDLLKKKPPLMEECYVVSINRKNSTLKMALNSLGPLHISFDEGYGRKETAKLFTQLNLATVEESGPEELLEKFLARSRPRFEVEESVMDLEALESLPVLEDEYDEDDMMAEEGEMHHHATKREGQEDDEDGYEEEGFEDFDE